MSEELFRELEQMQRQAAGLYRLIEEAQSKAPETALGEDSKGAVVVRLGPDGLPDEIRVASDWRRRVDQAGLSAAVLEAFGVAAESRMNAWTRRLEGDEWQAKAERLMREDAQQQPFTTPMSDVPPMFRREPEPVHYPRHADELAEEVLKAFDNVEELAASSPLTSEFVGKGASGQVTVTLSATAGLVNCTIDSYWVSDQSTSHLNNVLHDALSSARRQVAAAGDAPSPTAHLDSLFDEAIGLLNNSDRLAG